jgi:radical SAM family uncharacterized protein
MVATASQIKDQLERILLRVQKPGRYVGGEYNQVLKDWDSVQTHVALVFPDIYDLGVPNLGLAILYESINQRPDVLAERAYSPWTDMEDLMRERSLPLYALESKQPLACFDLIGVSLPYETLYTNFLNVLDLAGIPIFSKDRTEQQPLIIAGGHACFNPEPMAEFVDAFVVGEGEEVIHEIINAHQDWKKSGAERQSLLRRLAGIQGVYVPAFYQPEYTPDGRLARMQRTDPAAPAHVLKRIVARLPEPPTHFIVPSIDVVHNRVAIEIMRGCTHGCRFCHAGMITRPIRERPVEQILSAIENAMANTGYEEVALLSLSSSDYSHILELVQKMAQQFEGRHLTVSLPSLRIESTSVDLVETLRGSHQTGFTLAPEAATERMRNIINKPIPTEQLLETARAIYSRGWPTIKLYFMIGHPSETLEDVQAIADLCRAVLTEGRRAIGRRASLHAGVSTFIPKAHTPFQWGACDTEEQIQAKQRLLMKQIGGPGFKLNWTDPKDSMMEAWLARGDRRMGQVIYRAWQLGAKFDAWQDKNNIQLWMKAFEENGLNPDFYTHRQRALDEVLPWDHINIGVSKAYLVEDFERSQREELQPDCREKCFACGILPAYKTLRQENPGEAWRCPEVGQRQTVSAGMGE